MEARAEIDKVVNETLAALSYVTVVNTIYCFLVIYTIVFVLYGIITIKKVRLERRMNKEKLKTVKVEK